MKDNNREAFEKYIQTVAHPHRSPKAMFFTVNDGYGNIIYADSIIQDQWSTWQAAVKHVVPEGLRRFCNEHKDPTWRGRLTEYDKGYSDCCIAVLEMIEVAQENTND